MAKNKKLYVMCGIPGSGKSHWLRAHAGKTHFSYAVISRDTVRFSMVKEDEEYFSKEKEVFKEFINLIKKSLYANEETYVDATHLNEASRGKLLYNLRDSLKDIKVICIYIKVSLDTALKQNDLREGRSYVPHSVIRRMYSQLTVPSVEEGFDEVWVYQSEGQNIKYQVYKKE